GQGPAAAAAGRANRCASGPATLPVAMGCLAALAVVVVALWGNQPGQNRPSPATPDRPAANRTMPQGQPSTNRLAGADSHARPAGEGRWRSLS
ncbi:MAG: hypothetical protein WAM11_10890, partial [Cyanobium sp.]